MYCILYIVYVLLKNRKNSTSSIVRDNFLKINLHKFSLVLFCGPRDFDNTITLTIHALLLREGLTIGY